MTDLLYISFVKDENSQETGLCVGRVNKDGSHTVLKMELDSQADILYKILTDQSAKVIPIERVEQIKQEVKKWYWDNDIQSLRKDSCVVDAMTDMFLRMLNKAIGEVSE